MEDDPVSQPSRPRVRLPPGWIAGEAPGYMPDAEMRARAVGLGNRLLDVEDERMGLRAALSKARRELDRVGAVTGTGGAWFDVPRARYPWLLAEASSPEEVTLGPYDRRVDDAVVLEGWHGRRFLDAYRLMDGAPDFVGAVGALNDIPRRLRLVDAGDAATPDVSIIIPVHGQLGYTLNCIDSLLRHESRFDAEIIVIDDCSPDRTGEFVSLVQGLRYHRQPGNEGFIRSCNDGAALARGRFVAMLNNDTRVVPGWLDALLDTFGRWPAAGLVGSKMCYADGSLQEAGGIIWRDGSCWNYGRHDDGNRPHYSHARRVDYVSGCSLALPIELWRSLGGFDAYYSPAYCEDADLGMRVSEAGREVWYQPQSRVVHYEGKTGGTDTASGAKAYQVVNMRKLYLRWRERLEGHRANAEAPYFEREREVRRRMLVVDVTVPTPNQDAGSVQTVLGMRVCQALGYKTYFVSEDNWLFDPAYTPALQEEGIECAYAPYDLGFQGYIRRYGALFDVVLVYRMGVLERVIEDIRQFAPQAALLFHVADLHFLRRQREAALEGSAEGLLEADAIRRRELLMVGAADCTITHSSIEASILAAELPEAPVVVWPLMFDFFGTTVGFPARRDICFLGGYRHPPNVDAMRYFVAEVLPLIRAADPLIRLLIAGAHPSREVLALAGEGVEVVGMVPDLRTLFDRARVFVCPLRFGAGVKGKVMSALAYGLPIVSTTIGVEGSGLIPGEHVLVADRTSDFAAQTLRLYRDEDLWTRLSVQGQALLRAEFSPEGGRRKLGEAIERGNRRRMDLPED